MVAEFGPEGCPFYCGKTVQVPKVRLRHHRSSFALSRYPNRPVTIRIRQCINFVRIKTVEIVAFGEDWAAREKAWIALLRTLNPAHVTNISDGGESQTPGWKHKPETLIKIGAVHKGKKFSPERCAAMSAERKGCIISPETRIKISAANKGQKRSAEFSANQSAARKGLVRSPEHCARLSIAAKRRGPITAARNSQRVWSDASRTKLRDTMLRRHAERARG